MIKNFNIKYLPVIFIFILTLYSVDINAAESVSGENNFVRKVEIKQKQIERSALKKGFLKKKFKKISEKIKETKRRIIKKIKRFFSKRKAKKERMKSSFRNRHHNLFNILVFSGIFILLAAGIIALFLYGIINSSIFLILSLILIIPSIVIALIYFSNRYILKPHYRS